jgi:uncharacterized protein YukE
MARSPGQHSPMGLADPDELEQLATQLDGRAEEVREQTGAFRAEVGQVAWQSAGADHYRDRCADLCSDLEGNAQQLNDAADDLRAHAQAVRDKLAWMHDMVDQLRDEAEELWDDAKGPFEWGADKASDAWGKVTGWL